MWARIKVHENLQCIIFALYFLQTKKYIFCDFSFPIMKGNKIMEIYLKKEWILMIGNFLYDRFTKCAKGTNTTQWRAEETINDDSNFRNGFSKLQKG